MSSTSLNASIEKRLETLVELARRNHGTDATADKTAFRPGIAVSREFGCQGMAVSQRVQSLLEEQTGDTWGMMDRLTLDKVANEKSDNMDFLRTLGEKNSFIDEMMATVFTKWQSDRDYYRILCSQIISFAKGGHVIIAGAGASILTQNLPNCYQFRIVAPLEYRVESVSKRHNLSREDARDFIVRSQKQRIAFINDFLNRDISDPNLYNMVFNEEKNSVDQIATMICQRVMADAGKESLR